METFENILIRVLMVSVGKNGADKPVTLGHLLNIIRLAKKIERQQADDADEAMDEALMQIYTDQCGDRD